MDLSPRQHVEKIAEEFSDLKPRVRSGYEAFQRILSEDLYSREDHFVYELIQNADDNKYAADVAPMLHFDLLSSDPTNTRGCDGCLVVRNNEIGLTEADVDALCAIGASTKKSRRFIGEKGIGFKSVFCVSPRPLFCSAGYQFALGGDGDGAPNFTCPTWCERPPIGTRFESTTIFLPLKNGKLQFLRQRLSALPPATLLFLRRLRRLVVTFDSRPVSETTLEKRGAPAANLEHAVLRGASGSTDYWVFSSIATKPAAVTEEHRTKATDTEVTLALPCSEQPEAGRLFVYLPTELHTGFPVVTAIS
jgi:hypothetical protein